MSNSTSAWGQRVQEIEEAVESLQENLYAVLDTTKSVSEDAHRRYAGTDYPDDCDAYYNAIARAVDQFELMLESLREHPSFEGQI